MTHKVNLRSWFSNAALGIMIFVFSLVAAGAERLGTLSRRPFVPTVDSATLNEWTRDIFEMEEVWVIKDFQKFFKMLVQSGLDHGLISKLQKEIRSHISYAQAPKILTYYNWGDGTIDGILLLSPELKNQIPNEPLKHIYTYLLNDGLAPPDFKFQNYYQAQQFFEQFGLSENLKAKVLLRTFEIDGNYHFFFTPDLWSEMNTRLKMVLIRAYTEGQAPRTGLKIDLTFTAQDDIAGIAAKYASDRNPRALERYLRLLLKRSKNGVVNIPLSQLMQPFIRKNINSHTMCSGANCFNSGVSVNEGNWYQQFYLSQEKDLLEILVGQYRFVQPNEPLKQDDFLLYRSADGELVHVSTFITEDIVFTKNGLTKFNPYIFQTKEQNIDIYFEDGKYTLTALRLPQKGESPMAAKSVNEFKAEEIFYENNTGSKALGPLKPALEHRNPHPNFPAATPSSAMLNRCIHIYKVAQ